MRLSVASAGPAGSRGLPEGLPFQLAPPLACERLQEPRKRRNDGSRALLLTLIAIVVGGSIGYYMSAAGFFSTLEFAQAAALVTR
jgi:hypothetical protein